MLLPARLTFHVLFWNSFLLTFRLNYSYGRYWEGATSVHQMLSKWMDCAMCLGAYHYQSEQFKDIAPPTLGTTSRVADQIRDRSRTFAGYEDKILKRSSPFQHTTRKDRKFWKTNKVDAPSVAKSKETRGLSGLSIYGDADLEAQANELSGTIPIPVRFQDQFLAYGGAQVSLHSSESVFDRMPSRGLEKRERGSRNVTKTLRAKMPSPSLFMQEATHLMSLLSAVALSTLRNDVDQAASPVVPYFPNSPWPPVDPDQLSQQIKGAYGASNSCWGVVYFCLGLSRSKIRRTLYNAARPFGVLGGVSDEEIKFLQRARGPYAKVALVTLWLQEFLSREYLSGSTGTVHPPVLSRLYQFIRFVLQSAL